MLVLVRFLSHSMKSNTNTTQFPKKSFHSIFNFARIASKFGTALAQILSLKWMSLVGDRFTQHSASVQGWGNLSSTHLFFATTICCSLASLELPSLPSSASSEEEDSDPPSLSPSAAEENNRADTQRSISTDKN